MVVNSKDNLQPTLLAGCLTAGLFLVLPFVHIVKQPLEQDLDLIEINQSDLPQPPLMPLPELLEEKIASSEPPKPELAAPEVKPVPLKTVLDYEFDAPDLGGDFDLSFNVSTMAAIGLKNASVFALSDVDQIPQPLVQIEPFYPAHARMRQIEGSVLVEFVVTADGQTDTVKVLSSEPGTLFCQAAVNAVQRWLFKPGVRDGQPVAVRVQQRIRFELE